MVTSVVMLYSGCMAVIFTQYYKLSNGYLTVNSEFSKQAQREALKLKLALTLPEAKEGTSAVLLVKVILLRSSPAIVRR